MKNKQYIGMGVTAHTDEIYNILGLTVELKGKVKQAIYLDPITLRKVVDYAESNGILPEKKEET